MKRESKGAKYCIAGLAAFVALFCFGLSLYWMIRADSANLLDRDQPSGFGDGMGIHLYDSCGQASDLSYVDLHEICGEDQESCLSNFDTNWHVIFEFNGVVLLFVSIAYATVAVGAFFYHIRLIGAIASCFMNFLHMIVLIVTASYRFSTHGRLCALSQKQSFYEGNGKFTDDWSYQKDANLMVDLWGL